MFQYFCCLSLTFKKRYCIEVQALNKVPNTNMPPILLCVVKRLYLSFSVTEKGELCVFPFKYKGKTYEECVTEGKNRPWCATTENYQGDEKWGFCSSSKYLLYFMYKGLS